MPRSRLIALAAAALVVAGAIVALVLADEGGGPRGQPPPELSATQPRVPGGSGDAAVIEAWARTLALGEPRRAAAYFAVPATVQPEPSGPAQRLTTRRQVRAFNRKLNCGAIPLRAVDHGRYTIAVLRLIERPGAQCDAPGTSATLAFLIREGRIVEWRRVPDVAIDRTRL